MCFFAGGFVFVVVSAAATASAVIVPATVAAFVGALRHLFGEGGHRRHLRAYDGCRSEVRLMN